MDLGIVPVGLRNGCLQIVDHQSLGHAAEVVKGVFEALDECFGSLPPDRFTVGLAAVAQHDTEAPWPTTLAVAVNHRRAGAEIDLGLLARRGLQTPEGKFRLPLQPIRALTYSFLY